MHLKADDGFVASCGSGGHNPSELYQGVDPATKPPLSLVLRL